MLSAFPVYATIGVKDYDKAKEFYGGTLGLKIAEGGKEDPDGTFYQCGSSQIFVYQSQYGGTNQATSATWLVKDVEAEVKDLKGKGVTFEHYDFPGVTREGDIHIMGDIKAAWFKDPDGNILNISNM